ncbi:MAG: hypothetical protein Q7R91_02505 [bacterium]|nr:hypothetical protein [bacterium]
MVALDHVRCRALGKFFKELRFPEAAKIDPPGDLSGPDLRMLYFIVVAICHQTSPIGKPRLAGMVNGRLLFGWDYLCASWLAAAKADPSILTPGWLMFTQASDIIYLLYDSHRHCGSHITDSEGRAKLLRDIGFRMYCDGVGHIDEYYKKADGYLLDVWFSPSVHTPGLESLFSKFEAYGKDPVKKKLTYFLTLMNRYGFWRYRDIHHLGVPVDYHEVRLHLRLGTVKITDTALAAKVAACTVLNAEEDVCIRSATHRAIVEISEFSGRMPADIHNFFWNMARNCCMRDKTHCAECGSHSALPERYAGLLAEGRCVFANHCASVSLAHSEKPKEPVVDTDFY